MTRKGDRISVIVHSLGSVDAPAGTVMLEAPDGSVLASAPVAALAAPSDLTPRLARVSLVVPKGAPSILHVRVSTGMPEVTRRNNLVVLDGEAAR